ncbi:MAG: hypothetical protein MHM6MM_001923 [Cercozoa sp. M6MM]
MSVGEETWFRLREAVTCTICYGLLDGAVSLPCGHVFCSACIRAQLRQRRATCPTCAQGGRPSSGGNEEKLTLGDLKNAWRLERLASLLRPLLPSLNSTAGGATMSATPATKTETSMTDKDADDKNRDKDSKDSRRREQRRQSRRLLDRSKQEPARKRRKVTTLPCPVCKQHFPASKLQQHANTCNAADAIVILSSDEESNDVDSDYTPEALQTLDTGHEGDHQDSDHESDQTDHSNHKDQHVAGAASAFSLADLRPADVELHVRPKYARLPLLSVMKDAELRKYLKKLGLTPARSKSSRTLNEALLRRYVTQHNANCDRWQPRSPDRVIRQVEQQQRQQLQQQHKKKCSRSSSGRNAFFGTAAAASPDEPSAHSVAGIRVTAADSEIAKELAKAVIQRDFSGRKHRPNFDLATLSEEYAQHTRQRAVDVNRQRALYRRQRVQHLRQKGKWNSTAKKALDDEIERKFPRAGGDQRQLFSRMLLLLSALLVSAVAATPVVRTSTGALEGVDQNGVHTYLGVPFAEPPVGDRRFMDPAPKSPWHGVYRAVEEKPGCPQECLLPVMEATCPSKTSEDCLYLNVFVPADATSTSNLPVMFFIHGGNFDQGHGAGDLYDAADYVRRRGDVVLVSTNYRLGALGFLRTEHPLIRGNQGIRDQRLALKWVRDNIVFFGGDKDEITIFGESAGGSSVATHLTAPRSHGLFKRAIMMSNPAGLPLFKAKNGAAFGASLSDSLGCNKKGLDLECLQSVDVATIVKKQQNHLRAFDKGDFWHVPMPWSPTVDGDELPMHPLRAWKQGQLVDSDKVPTFVVGHVREEGLLFTDAIFGQGKMTQAAYRAALVFAFGLKGYNAIIKMDDYRIDCWYNCDYSDKMALIATDYIFHCPDRVAARGFAHDEARDVFSYDFDYVWSFEGAWSPHHGCEGHVCHASELPFVFDRAGNKAGLKFTPAEEQLATEMSDAFANIAATGNPNCKMEGRCADVGGTTWPRFNALNDADFAFIFRGGQQRHVVEGRMRWRYCDFWDEWGYRSQNIGEAAGRLVYYLRLRKQLGSDESVLETLPELRALLAMS